MIEVKTTCVGVVRRTVDSGKHHILLSELGADHEHARQLAEQNNAQCGKGWADANPIVETRKVMLMTLPD